MAQRVEFDKGFGASGFWSLAPWRCGARPSSATRTMAAKTRLTLCGAAMPPQTCALRAAAADEVCVVRLLLTPQYYLEGAWS